MQVQTQAAQHTRQIEDILAACNSMRSQYTIAEQWARNFETWALKLEARTSAGFDWAEKKFEMAKQSTSISKEAEATILRLTEDIEKSKESTERLQQSLEAKQREELERIRKDAVKEFKQNAKQSNERLRQSLEAKQREELERIRKDAAEAKQLAMAASQ